ncbi:MAG: fimbria major subunit [Muribaculaceae bacterium]|nr:fimbria major subunit [Muribaculaceae bacterium]
MRVARTAAMFLLLLTVSLLTACRDSVEDPDEPHNPGFTTYTGKLYCAIILDEPSGAPSRADYGGNNNDDYEADFEDGVQNYESRIDNVTLLFFENNTNNNNSNNWTLWKAIEANNLSSSDGNTDSEDPGKNEDIAWKKTIVVELNEEETTLDVPENLRLVAVVNSYDHYDGTTAHNINWSNISTLADFESLTCGTYQNASEKGFLMTTAGHYISDNNSYVYYNTYNKSELQIFFNSRSQAENHPITIYVERLAAKVNLEINKTSILPVEVVYGTDIYKLNFTPESWALSATESQEYIAKRTPAQGDITTANGYHSDFFNWLNYNYHRCFWAESVNFNVQGSYPANAGSTGTTTLKYPKFKEITETLSESSEGKFTGSLYTLEHTFNATELKRSGVNPYAVPTSIVAYGYYTAVKSGTDLKPAPGTGSSNPTTMNFNNNGGGFYLREIDMERDDQEKVLKYRLYVKNSTSDELYNALLQEQYEIWVAKKDKDGNLVWENGQLVGDHPVKAEDGLDIFEVKNTFKRYDTVSKSWIQNASNEYTLQLKSNWQALATQKGVTLLLAKYDTSTKKATYDELSTTNVATANNQLQQHLGSCQYYDKGYAFFYAPIPHYSGKEDPFKNNNEYTYKGNFKYTSGAIDHKTGDFGVVRNHIYDFKISGISGLGFGKTKDDDIPLPEVRPDNQQYYFDIQLEILPWHVFRYTFDI